MSMGGTAAYAGVEGLPEPVERAVRLATGRGFAHSCRPEQGRLLAALAGGAAGVIGETGTGCGVGLAWLASAAPPGARLVSVERDPDLAAAVGRLFGADDRVTVECGDWREIAGHAPFDLLVLDGGGSGKAPGDEPADPEALLAPEGTVVVDDFTPGRPGPDPAREHWLGHPALRAVELRLAADLSSVVGVRRSRVGQGGDQ
ncbi:O-methyltransferase [Streptomyces millisiae]|uniref:Class I SAM-dependent methyltransferase n=1 Tax=Streptomyces millisiae TaxID=3075542 RepID=A0ABU2LY65_9ACTN|nr:class I SAM-dependent methyltransferase [Streptomyces sp. DSM 44918]MDT0322516.1 class I SAM-dependent methyltransferase [Streptomyces sp. DSM 44918]